MRAEAMFWMLVSVIAGFGLIMTSLDLLTKSQTEWRIDFKKRRIAFICLPTGLLLILWSTLGMLSSIDGTRWTGIYLMVFFAYLMIPANEFDRMAYYVPYGKDEIEKKYKRAKVLTYVLFGVLEFIAFRILFFDIMGNYAV